MCLSSPSAELFSEVLVAEVLVDETDELVLKMFGVGYETVVLVVAFIDSKRRPLSDEFVPRVPNLAVV